MLPTSPDDPGAAEGQAAAEGIAARGMPSLCLWADSDPIIPLKTGQAVAERLNLTPPETIENAAHFLQEDRRRADRPADRRLARRAARLTRDPETRRGGPEAAPHASLDLTIQLLLLLALAGVVVSHVFGVSCSNFVIACHFSFLVLQRAWTYLPFFTVVVKRADRARQQRRDRHVELAAVALRGLLARLELADEDRGVVHRVRAGVQEQRVLACCR